MHDQETITVTTEAEGPQGHVSSVDAANAKLREAVQARLAGCPPAARVATDVLATAYDRRQRAGIVDEGEAWPLPHETAPMQPQRQTLRPGSEQFIAVLEELKALHLRKTLDYGIDEDALSNIRSSADVVNMPAWAGCILRISDKLHRLKAFFRRGKVEFDGVEDTLADICCYAAIALVLYREERR